MPVGTDFADVFATAAPRAPETYAARAPDNDIDEPSFEDHLSAETDNEPPVRETAAADEPAPEESAPDPADTDPSAALIARQASAQTPPPAQPQQQPASQPAMIQIIASLNAAAEQTADAAAAAAETPAPTTPPPAAPPPIQNPNPQPQTGKAQTRKANAAEKSASANATAQPASVQAPDAGAETPVVAAAPEQIGEQAQQPPQQQGQPQTADATVAPPINAAPQTPQQTPPPSANAQAQAPSTEPGAGTDAIGTVTPDPITPGQSAAKPADPGKAAAPPPPDFKIEPEQQAPQAQQNEAVQRAAPKRAANEAKSAAPQAKDAFSALLAQTTDAQTPRATSAPAQAPLTANTSATASASASAHAGVHTPANQVAREIIRRQTGGNTRFELRLDPPELGRVEVRLEVTRDQKVTAIVSADNPQALADLTRHARDLEQSLQSAGLELSENGLSFDLSQSRQGQQDENDSTGVKSANSDANSGEPETPQIIRASPLGLERWSGHRIDLVA